MPLYIRLLGYATANVKTTVQRDAIRRALDDIDNHTDETLSHSLQNALSDYPDVWIHCLTILDQGTVSAFDSDRPSALLHRISSRSADSTGVEFVVPSEEPRVDLGKMKGFAEMHLSSVPDDLLLSHESFADAMDMQDEDDQLNFPTWFDDRQHLDVVLARLCKLVTNSIVSFTMIDTCFFAVELGPGRASVARMKPKTSATHLTRIAEDILTGKDPFPGELTHEKPAWLSDFTSSSSARFEKACRNAMVVLDDMGFGEEAKQRRRDLVGPLLHALSELALNDDRRHDLWDIACRLRSGKVRAAAIEALKAGDSALREIRTSIVNAIWSSTTSPPSSRKRSDPIRRPSGSHARFGF